MGYKYDNERDRNIYGYDAGTIVDGSVVYDGEKKEFILVDEDGLAFSSQQLLSSLVGKRVRFTCVSFESMEVLEKLMNDVQSDKTQN